MKEYMDTRHAKVTFGLCSPWVQRASDFMEAEWAISYGSGRGILGFRESLGLPNSIFLAPLPKTTSPLSVDGSGARLMSMLPMP